MRALLLISIVLLTLAPLTGCGQSGDLYLPPREQPAPPAETAPAPAPEQPQEKDKK